MTISEQINFFIDKLNSPLNIYHKQYNVEELEKIKKEVCKLEKNNEIMKRALIELAKQGQGKEIRELLKKCKESIEKQEPEDERWYK